MQKFSAKDRFPAYLGSTYDRFHWTEKAE